MCQSFPLPCTQAHHKPVMLEIWANSLVERDLDIGLGMIVHPSALLVATRTDEANAESIIAQTYIKGGITAIVTDWITGEARWVRGPHKRRQVSA